MVNEDRSVRPPLDYRQRFLGQVLKDPGGQIEASAKRAIAICLKRDK
jgi:hypothetical protein